MRKSLLALALAVTFPAAFAQSQSTNGVELYGIVDIGAEFVDNGSWTNVLGQKGDVSVNRITSGISTAERERIGAPPRGHGLLGLIIRDSQAIRIGELVYTASVALAACAKATPIPTPKPTEATE